MEHLKREVRVLLVSNKEEFAFERKILHDVALPQIRRHCLQEFNIEFVLLDPHFEVPGVQNPPFDVNDSIAFLREAQDISNGISCMAFIGEKLDGPHPPPHLPADIYQNILASLKAKNDPLWMLFQKKYSEVPNSWPAKCKLNATGMSAEEAEELIRGMKNGVEVAVSSGKMAAEDCASLFQTDLDRIMQAVLTDRLGAEQTIAIFRDLQDRPGYLAGPNPDPNVLRTFLDVTAGGSPLPGGVQRCAAFKEAVKKRLPRENWTRYELAASLLRDLARKTPATAKKRPSRPGLIRSLSDDQLNPAMSVEEYRELLAKDLVERVKYHVTRLMRRFEFYADVQFRDVELHRALLHRVEEPAELLNRQRELKILDNYLTSNARTPGLLVGEPGSGKSTLLKIIEAKVPSLMTRGEKPLVVVRSSGMSSAATSLQQLLASVTAQISAAFRKRAPASCEYAVNVYDFWRSLELARPRRPIILLLDDAERLYPAGHTELFRWLPHRLPPHVKCLLTTSSEAIASGFRKRYDESSAITIPSPDAQLLFNGFPARMEARGKRPDDAAALEAANHCLQQNASPVYAALLADLLPAAAAEKLSDRIRFLFAQRVEQLEGRHPAWLLRFALSYLAASRFGLSLLELQDVLSLDNFVLGEAKFDSKGSPAFRLPLQFLASLLHSLAPYLQMLQLDDRLLYTFRHEAFRAGVIETYQLGKEFGAHIHQALADFWQGRYGGDGRAKPMFDKTMDSEEGLTISIDRLAPAQPYYWAKDQHAGEITCNARKLAELPLQLLKAEKVGDLFRYALFCFEYIYAKLLCSSVNDLISEVYFVRQAYEVKTNQELDILISLLRLLQGTLEKNPDLLGPELVGRLSHLVGTQGLFTMLHQQIDLFGPKVNCLIPTVPCYPTVDAGEMRIQLETKGHVISAMSPDNRYISTLFPSTGPGTDTIIIVWDAKSVTKTQIINLGPQDGLTFHSMVYMPQSDDYVLLQFTEAKNAGYLCVNIDIAAVGNKFSFPLDQHPELLFLAKSYVTLRVGGVPRIFLYSTTAEAREFKDLAWPFVVTPSDKYAVAPRQPKSKVKELSGGGAKVDHSLRIVNLGSGENLCVLDASLPSSYLLANVRNEVLFSGSRTHGKVVRYDIGQVAKKDVRRLKPGLELNLEVSQLPPDLQDLYERYRAMTSVTKIALSIDEKYILVDFNISEIKHVSVVWQLMSKSVTLTISRTAGDVVRFSTDGTHVFRFHPCASPVLSVYAVNSGELVLNATLRANIQDAYITKNGSIVAILPTEIVLTSIQNLQEQQAPDGDQVQNASTSLISPRYNQELNVVFSNDLQASNFAYFNLDSNSTSIVDMSHNNPSLTRFPLERHIAPDGSKLILVYGSQYSANMRAQKRSSVTAFMMHTGTRGHLIQDPNDFRKPEIPGVNYFTGPHPTATEMIKADGVYEQRILRVFDTAACEVTCQISLTGERVLQLTNRYLLTFKPDFASLTREANNASDIVSIYDITTGEYVNSTYLDHPVITSVLVDNNSKLLVSCGRQGRWVKMLGGKMLDQVLNKVDIEAIMKWYDEYARSVNIRCMFVFPDNISAVLLSYYWKEPEKEIFYAKIDLNKKDVVSQFSAQDHIQDVTRDGKFGVDRGLRVYDLQKGEVLRQLSTASSLDNDNFLGLSRFTEDGSHVVVLDNVAQELSVIQQDAKAHVIGRAPLHRVQTSPSALAPFDLTLGQAGRVIVVHNRAEFKVFVLRELPPKGKKTPDPAYQTLAERSRYLMPGKRSTAVDKLFAADRPTKLPEKKEEKKEKAPKRARSQGKGMTPVRENTMSPATKKTDKKEP